MEGHDDGRGGEAGGGVGHGGRVLRRRELPADLVLGGESGDEEPGAEIIVRNGGTQANAVLWTWQEDRDLALLVVPRVSPPLPWAGDNHVSKAGDKIFVAADDTSLAQGKITSVSSTGIEHDVVIDGLRQGGPLVNDRGEVLGMASAAYNPGGVGTDRIFIAVPIRDACQQVLSCSSGSAAASPPTTATR